MCYNCSLVWHNNGKIHIIDNLKAPTVSSCFKCNGAEIVNSLFFTGVFSLAAIAQSKHVPSSMPPLHAHMPALLWQKIMRNRYIFTFLFCFVETRSWLCSSGLSLDYRCGTSCMALVIQ
jgi:hypothetical protein